MNDTEAVFSKGGVGSVRKLIVFLLLSIFAMHLAVLFGADDSISRWLASLEFDGDVPPVQVEELLPPSVSVAEGEAEVVYTSAPSATGDYALNSGEQYFENVINSSFPSDLSIRNDSSTEIDVEALSRQGLRLPTVQNGPQVLIIHTHGSEAYTQAGGDTYVESDPYRTEDKSQSVIKIGDVLAEVLCEKGLSVIHDREIYDSPSYTGSYTRSGNAVEKYLEKYPGIAVVIDLHRDALGSGDTVYKTKAEPSLGECAQVMLLVGTGENGLYHPNWEENLKLALYLQSSMEDKYPSLARPLSIKSERYNQHLSTGSIILEVGSTGNTLSEAINAVRYFGDAAGDTIKSLLEFE